MRSLWATRHYTPSDGVELRSVKTCAHLAGWVAAREHGMRNVATSDAIAEAAVTGVLDLMTEWEGQNKNTGWPDQSLPGKVVTIPIPGGPR